MESPQRPTTRQSISLSGNQLEGNVAEPSSERIDIDRLPPEWHNDEVLD